MQKSVTTVQKSVTTVQKSATTVQKSVISSLSDGVENADVRTWNCGQRARKTQPPQALGLYKFASIFSNTRGWVYWVIHGGGRLYMDDILG